MEPTGNFGTNEESEDKERIVECYPYILWTVGLKSNGGVNAACSRSDIRSHEVIYKVLVLFHKLSTVHTATSERVTGI